MYAETTIDLSHQFVQTDKSPVGETIEAIKTFGHYGIVKIYDKYKPNLRGFSALSHAFPPDQQIRSSIDGQLFFPFVKLMTRFSERTRRYSDMLAEAERLEKSDSFADTTRAMMIKDYLSTHSLPDFEDVEKSGITYLDPLLVTHDEDLKLNEGDRPENVLDYWKSLGLPSDLFFQVGTDVYYGLYSQLLPTKTPGMNRANIQWGYYYKLEDKYYLMSADGNYDFMPFPQNGVEMRGVSHGLSTDAVRARHKLKETFELDMGTVQDEIHFPQGRVDGISIVTIPRHWMHLASRANMQNTWLDLNLKYPPKIVELSPEIAEQCFKEDPLLRDCVIKYNRDAFMFNPRQAFYNWWKSRLYQASPLTYELTYEQFAAILNELPDQEIHKRNLKNLGLISLPQEAYSVFEILAKAFNNHTKLHLDPNRDWLILHDLYPDPNKQ